ncbi:hypothetical protein FOL47_009936 [Perkinsus chesapeaki]|uniref:Uncharacterized protein n=1 Tax=Perkinsus chesapeaki TaxID=330153 RepID=A0A7J6MQP8_PERCH|nr:hypothetical protein FOL47_009936 [Perkinsus chesapeaki]
MPPLLNQMVIVAATPKISDALKRLGKRVTSETYYTVDLYRVDVTDLVATYKNKLRVMPQNYTIYSVINEPNQNYSAEQPQLSVRIVDNLVTSEATYVSEWNSPAGGELNVRDIPGTDKFTFQQKVSDSLTLTRSYYRHVPIDGNIRGILIQYHGWRNTCESFEEESQMTAIADKHGLMLIHACGSEYGFYSSYFKYIHGWNAGTCCIQRDDINDVEYTRMILARENHNHLPVYGYGYSNGGMMVEALLCHKVIDMAVSVNGVLALHPGLQGSLKTCDNIYSKTQRLVVPSVASIHCVDDEVVPYNGSTYGTTLWDWSRFYFVNDMFPRTNKDMRRWARRLGCERKASHKEKINDWTRLQEWVCPGQERVVSIKRFNCSYQGGFAHSVIRTPDFDPAEWAVNFFVRNGPSNP